MDGHGKGPDAAPLARQWWGRVGYEAAWRRQLELVARVRADPAAETVVGVEHPPTATLGRHACDRDVLVDAAERRRIGMEVVRSDRGGQATYHGPGQAVVYPIVHVRARRLAPRAWVCLLEDTLLATLAAFDVTGTRRAGAPGIWADGAKVASIGLRIARGVSYHGVSINVTVDAGAFAAIVTCGVAGERVSSISALTGRRPPLEQVHEVFADAVDRRLRDYPRRHP